VVGLGLNKLFGGVGKLFGKLINIPYLCRHE
jgi:hypothetical protein